MHLVMWQWPVMELNNCIKFFEGEIEEFHRNKVAILCIYEEESKEYVLVASHCQSLLSCPMESLLNLLAKKEWKS